jgi:tRNA1(Val) A37 N6-methylase TrmN6
MAQGGPGEPVEDSLFSGRLVIFQQSRGYRVNIDTLLLADFAATSRPSARRVVDLGAGVGALALAYAYLGKAARIDLVERDAALARLSRLNLEHAGALGDAHVVDLARDGLPAPLVGVADVVLSNPPYFPDRAGSTAEHPGKRTARMGPLAPFVLAASAALARRAYAFFAYPAPALPELLDAARAAGFVAKRLRLVHAFANSAARLALVELRRAKPGGLVVTPPLIEWSARTIRSPEIETLLASRPRARP